MQFFQNGAKVGQKMNVKYGQVSLLDCFKKAKIEPVTFSNYWLFHFILQ